MTKDPAQQTMKSKRKTKTSMIELVFRMKWEAVWKIAIPMASLSKDSPSTK